MTNVETIRNSLGTTRRPHTKAAQIGKRVGKKTLSADNLRQNATRHRFTAEFCPAKIRHPRLRGVKSGGNPRKSSKKTRKNDRFSTSFQSPRPKSQDLRSTMLTQINNTKHYLVMNVR
jgi:hypothetical protein